MKQVVRTDNAPQPIGPYSQAIKSGQVVFVAGQGCGNPQTGQLERGSVEQETRRVLENIKAILEAAGGSMADVVKTTCYLADMNDFGTVNEIYGTYFSQPAPARATVQAARLPRDARVEIDCIASLD